MAINRARAACTSGPTATEGGVSGPPPRAPRAAGEPRGGCPGSFPASAARGRDRPATALVHGRIRKMHGDLDRRYGPAMAQSVCPVISADDRDRLEAIVADRNRPQKHVARARLVLLSAERLDVPTVARRTRGGRPGGWHWQRRFAQGGV